MTTSSVAKKDTQKLQRAIVDGLEDVKAQDIRVFDTEHLSPLFERVIIASGTSNRQTKALSASVCDSVREAGFAKPRVEGAGNGEWVIVDCGAAVVHIFQPNFRLYYNLEELWGEKPVRLKFGAAQPETAKTAKSARVPAEVAAKPASSLRRSSAAKKGVQEAFPSKAQEKRALAAKGTALKSAARKTATAAPLRSPSPVKAVSSSTTAKAVGRSTTAKAVGVAPAAKPAVGTTPRRAPVKRAIKTVTVGSPDRKVVAKKSAPDKPAARSSTSSAKTPSRTPVKRAAPRKA